MTLMVQEIHGEGSYPYRESTVTKYIAHSLESSIYAGATAMAKYYEKSKDWTKAQAVYDYTAESSLLNFTSNQKRQLTRKKRSCKRKLEDEKEEAEHVKQMRKASSATSSE